MAAACVSMENLGQGLFGVQLEVDQNFITSYKCLSNSGIALFLKKC